MKPAIQTFCFWVTLALSGASSAIADSPRVVVAEIRGTIDPASSYYLGQAIERAQSENAEAVVVKLDTPGGLLTSVREMSQKIDESRVPVVVFVAPAGASATSAGAILMLASHVAAMSPGTAIGAAHPVGSGGEEIKGAMGEKALNDTAAFARGLAEVRGRPRELADEIVVKSRSLTSNEALDKGLIELEVGDVDQLLSKLDGRSVTTASGKRTIHTQGAIRELFEMSFGQRMLHLLANPNVTAILFSLGVLLIYLEFSTPGATFPGIGGAICLLIALMGTQLLPIRVGALLLLALGVGLLIAELFIGSFGVLGLGGILSFVLGLVWLVDPSASSWGVSPAVWAPIAIVMAACMATVSWAVVRSRRMDRGKLYALGAAGLGGLAGYPGVVESVGEGGRNGKARIRGELWDFQSDEPVKIGDRVEVVSIGEGMLARVRPHSLRQT